MSELAIVGEFNTTGGRPSKIGHTLVEALGWNSMNGGQVQGLNALVKSMHAEDWHPTAVLWMPDIPNYHDKILPYLKAKHPQLILISSKRCRYKYTDSDVVGRLLKSHSNLGIAIHERPHCSCDQRRHHYSFKLLDPLGNLFVDTDDIATLAEAIKARVGELNQITRLPTVSLGLGHPIHIHPEFLKIVARFGKEFANYVNAINPNRYLGNASTRCASGFPAEKQGDAIYVSRRNVPKDGIDSTGFVQVNGRGEYYGKQKPSVDTPIQTRLFQYYPAIRFMIHGHTYIKGAPMTESKLPCGAIEEYYEILKVVPDEMAPAFIVNLKGHGCIMACQDLNFFDTVELEARPFPES